MAHQIISAIVEAQDEKEALENGKEIFENLCGEGKPFDYYTTFEGEGTVVSGKDRWGGVPAVIKVDSDEGKKWIDKFMDITKNEFSDNLQRIRKVLEHYSDDDIFEGEVQSDTSKVVDKLCKTKDIDLHSVRYSMYCCGMYNGYCIWLYNNDGEGIRNQRDLKWALENNGKSNWIIPVDVHS